MLEKADVALLGYISATGRCPCPDIDSDGLENRSDGGTLGNLSDDTCASYVGNLPYRTIGLSAITDPWKNPLRYAVYEDLIKTTPNSGSHPFYIAEGSGPDQIVVTLARRITVELNSVGSIELQVAAFIVSIKKAVRPVAVKIFIAATD